MGFIAATCPNCSAHIQMDESANSCYCSYCGTLVERERININVSGYVKLDQSGQYGNYERLAESAFLACNYAEAYNYYAKMLELSINNPHAIFRKGLCAGYLSVNSSSFRIIEVLEGYSSSISLAGDNADIKNRITGEFFNLARAYSSPYFGKENYVFSDNAAFICFCNSYQNMIGRLYDMCSRVPLILGKQREEFLSLVLSSCSLATRKYNYYYFTKNNSGPSTQVKKLTLMPKNIQDMAGSIANRCKNEYFYLPHIQQQAGSLDAEIAFHQGNIKAYESAYNNFMASNPQYVSKKRNITVGGTLLVVLITIVTCFILLGISVALTPILLILIPVAITAACLIWKKMKRKKLEEIDKAYLPSEIRQAKEQSAASTIVLKDAKNKRASIFLK